MISSVGIVGYGSFGALLEKLFGRFAPDIEVRISSSRHKPDGKRFFSLADTARSDAIILAVPVHAFEDVLERILPLAKPESVLVDVATVKSHTVQLLRRYAGDRRYIAMHPMWGPESYEKSGGNIAGFRIVICDSTLKRAEHAALTEFLTRHGFDVVEMPPERHDKHLAETLFLTHVIGQTIARSGFGRTEIDTISFGHLMDAVESVRNDTQLFEDVYRFNPYCKEVLERFEISEKSVRILLEGLEKGGKEDKIAQ